MREDICDQAPQETAHYLEHNICEAQGSRKLSCVSSEHKCCGDRRVVVGPAHLGPEDQEDEDAQEEATEILNYNRI